MPITTVSQFLTSDGKSFDTLAEAEAHEIALEIDTEMDSIAERYDLPNRTATTLKRWLHVFIAELNLVKASTPSPDYPEDAPSAQADSNESGDDYGLAA